MTNSEQIRAGETLIEVLCLKVKRNGRVDTKGGA